jgi:hypothetical protein
VKLCTHLLQNGHVKAICTQIPGKNCHFGRKSPYLVYFAAFCCFLAQYIDLPYFWAEKNSWSEKFGRYFWAEKNSWSEKFGRYFAVPTAILKLDSHLNIRGINFVTKMSLPDHEAAAWIIPVFSRCSRSVSSRHFSRHSVAFVPVRLH